jgi:hypothetical protein
MGRTGIICGPDLRAIVRRLASGAPSLDARGHLGCCTCGVASHWQWGPRPTSHRAVRSCRTGRLLVGQQCQCQWARALAITPAHRDGKWRVAAAIMIQVARFLGQAGLLSASPEPTCGCADSAVGDHVLPAYGRLLVTRGCGLLAGIGLTTRLAGSESLTERTARGHRLASAHAASVSLRRLAGFKLHPEDSSESKEKRERLTGRRAALTLQSCGVRVVAARSCRFHVSISCPS